MVGGDDCTCTCVVGCGAPGRVCGGRGGGGSCSFCSWSRIKCSTSLLFSSGAPASKMLESLPTKVELITFSRLQSHYALFLNIYSNLMSFLFLLKFNLQLNFYYLRSTRPGMLDFSGSGGAVRLSLLGSALPVSASARPVLQLPGHGSDHLKTITVLSARVSVHRVTWKHLVFLLDIHI